MPRKPPEQPRRQILVDPSPRIQHRQAELRRICDELQRHPAPARRVLHRIRHQVRRHALHRHRIHKNGHREIGIPHLAQILRWIALRLIEKRNQLTGGEIRYLRKHLGFSSKEFAEFMSVKPETVSRWEGGTLSMSVAHEKNLRIAVRSGLDVLQYDIKPLRKAKPMPLAVNAQLVA